MDILTHTYAWFFGFIFGSRLWSLSQDVMPPLSSKLPARGSSAGKNFQIFEVATENAIKLFMSFEIKILNTDEFGDALLLL